MADNSVGMISLDLVIREKLGEQLEKIKARVSSPAEKIGEAVEEAIEKPMKNAGKAVADSVSKAMDEANRAMDNGIDDAVSRAVKRMEEQQKELENSLNKAVKPRAVPMGKSVVYDTAKIEQEIEEYNKKIEESSRKAKEKMTQPLEETMDKVKAKLGKFEIPADPVVRLWKEIGHANTQMSMLQKKWQELSAVDPTEKTVSELIKTEQQIMSTRDKLDKLHAKWAEYERAGSSAGAHTSSVFSRISSAAGKASSKIKSVLGKAFSHVKNAGSKAMSALGSRFKGIGKSAADSMKPVRKLGNTLKNTFRRVFLIAGIYAAFRALKDGFLSAAKADEEFNKSLNEVKANLAIAFTPIMQAVMPALNSLMSGLAAVTRQVAAFIAGLFGTTYKQAAEATKKLKGVTEAAKKAKLSAAGIDEMNILSSGSDDSGSSSGTDYSKIDMSEPELPDWAEKLKTAIRSGDWAGVGAVFAERVNAAFSAVNWDSISAKVNAGVRKVTDGINGFLDRFSDIGGWETLGDTVAGGLNTITGAIDTFYRTVKWGKLGSGIARGLNQAIKKTNWKQLGSAFAGHLQAMIETAFAFVKEFDFEGLGSGIGEAINSWFDRVDFGMAAQTLSMGIIGVLNSVSALLKKVNFGNIGGKIADFFNNIDIVGILGSAGTTISRIAIGVLDLTTSIIEKTDWFILGEKIFDGLGSMIANIDWGGLVKRSFELLGAAIGAALALAVSLFGKVLDLLAKAWKKVKNYFNAKIEEHGGNVVAGIFAGIIDALKNVGQWIHDHIFKPFIDGFKKAFGIASPSKEMAKMGGFIIDGLYNAISAGISRIKEVFTKMLNAIKGIFENIGDWFSDKFSKAWDGIKNVFSGAGSWFGERWNDIKDAFSDVSGFFSGAFEKAWSGIKTAFSDPKKFFSDVWDKIKSCFSGTENWFRDTFRRAWNGITDAFGNVKHWFRERVDDIVDAFSDLPDRIKDIFESVKDKIDDSGVADKIESVFEKLPGTGTAYSLGKKFGGWLGGKISNFFADGGELRTGEAIVGEEGPELLRMTNGKAKVIPLLGRAPALTMLGEGNKKNAAPSSGSLAKLGADSGDNAGIAEIIALLSEIVRLLKSGISAEVIGDIFGSSFKRAILKIIADDKSRRGQ